MKDEKNDEITCEEYWTLILIKLRLSSLNVTLRVAYNTRLQDDQGSNHNCIVSSVAVQYYGSGAYVDC